MEFLRASRRKNIVSETMYILLNIILAIVVLLLVTISGQVEVALLLVLLSKWRVLAVRTRYWYANIVANLVDLAVGFSTVGLIYLAGTASSQYALWLQISITIFHIVWLVFIKPRSGKAAMYTQALLGLFLGTWAIAAFAHVITLPVAVVLYYLVGYGAAYHILSIYKEQQPSLLAMVFGFIIAELGWVGYHWTAAYGIAEVGDLKIPQISLIMVLFALLIERCYGAYQNKQPLTRSEYLAPIIFSIVTTVVLLMLFGSIGAGIA